MCMPFLGVLAALLLFYWSLHSGPKLYTAIQTCFFKNKNNQTLTKLMREWEVGMHRANGGGLQGKDFAVCYICSFFLAESHLKQILFAFFSSEKKFLSQQNRPS